MFGSDIIAVVLAYSLAFIIRRDLPLFSPLAHGADLYLDAWPFLFLWPLGFWLEGLYPGWWHTAADELRRIVWGCMLAGLLTMSATFVTRTGPQYSRPIVVGGWLLSLVIVPSLRIPIKRLLSQLGLKGPPVVVIGAGLTAEQFLDGLARLKPPPYRVVAIFDDDPKKLGQKLGNAVVRGPISEAWAWSKEHAVRAAIIAMPGVEPARLVRIIQSLGDHFPKMVVVPNLFGMTAIDIVPRQVQGILGLELRQNLLQWWNQLVKRAIDIILLFLLLPVILLLCLLISLAILIESGWPVLFVHDRIGLRGKVFKAWKFRSMVHEADELFKNAIEQDSNLRDEWQQRQKVRRDPRLTRVGALIRRLSLDELPQFWNVLKGDMSLVGPRPIIHEEIEKYGDEYELYKKVRPGLTGLWQVSGRSDLPYEDRVWLDSHYVRNWSIWLDLIILVRTIGVVFSGRGAY